MRKNLQVVLNYFAYFSYSPSFDEIYTFFPVKITKKSLRLLLKKEVVTKKIRQIPGLSDNNIFRLLHCSSNHYPLATNSPFYTLPQYSISPKKNHFREGRNSSNMFPFKHENDRLDPLLRGDDKTRRIQTYLSILKQCSLVRFAGVTGRSAMEGLRSNDDLDLCIVTKRHCLWITRFCVVVLAKLLGIHGKSGVCLNLFFDERNLVIPRQKQNSYIGHELLQMKPVVDKASIYQLFLKQNEWIFRYFPNAAKLKAKRSKLKVYSTLSLSKGKLKATNLGVYTKILAPIDSLFKAIQIPLIHRNRTAFSITPTQLWLFKQDFQKKLERKMIVK